MYIHSSPSIGFVVLLAILHFRNWGRRALVGHVVFICTSQKTELIEHCFICLLVNQASSEVPVQVFYTRL